MKEYTATICLQSSLANRETAFSLKIGKVKAIRFSTLNAICRELNCQPGDIMEYAPGDENEEEDIE